MYLAFITILLPEKLFYIKKIYSPTDFQIQGSTPMQYMSFQRVVKRDVDFAFTLRCDSSIISYILRDAILSNLIPRQTYLLSISTHLSSQPFEPLRSSYEWKSFLK